MIQIIHQTTKNGLIPNELNHYIESIKKYQSNWNYILWSDDDNAKLIEKEYNFIWKNYQKIKGIQKADISRYCILHKFGGLYVDTDIIFYKNIDPLLNNKDGIILAPSIPTLPYFKNTVTNYIIYSGQKGNPFWLVLLYEINKRLEICDNWLYNLSILNPIIVPYTTGRVVLTNFMNDNYFTVFDNTLVYNKFSPLCDVDSNTVYCAHEGGTTRNGGKKWGNCIERYFLLYEFKMRKLLRIKQNSYQVPLCSIVSALFVIYFMWMNVIILL